MHTGVILAGGAGSRLGAPSKPVALLAGKPLISYPAAALAQVCERVVVVCKRDTELPGDLERWDEPDDPRHPLTGIVHALERAEGPVLVCAADMPFVTAETFEKLLARKEKGAAVCATNAGTLTPVLALYRESALVQLKRAPENAPLREAVKALEPATVELSEATSVNTPEDLAEAERRLSA